MLLKMLTLLKIDMMHELMKQGKLMMKNNTQIHPKNEFTRS